MIRSITNKIRVGDAAGYRFQPKVMIMRHGWDADAGKRTKFYGLCGNLMYCIISVQIQGQSITNIR